MYAQLGYFNGPRTAEQLAAAGRASNERIWPALRRDPELIGELIANYVLRQPDGGEVVVTIVKTRDALQRGFDLINSTELLPGEDPALLPGPDRVEVYEVVDARTSA
jgi:hypothetical protein